MQFFKIGRVLGVWWISNSFQIVKAIWESYEALYAHFVKCGLECTGLKKKKKTGVDCIFTTFSNNVQCANQIINFVPNYTIKENYNSEKP